MTVTVGYLFNRIKEFFQMYFVFSTTAYTFKKMALKSEAGINQHRQILRLLFNHCSMNVNSAQKRNFALMF